MTTFISYKTTTAIESIRMIKAKVIKEAGTHAYYTGVILEMIR